MAYFASVRSLKPVLGISITSCVPLLNLNVCRHIHVTCYSHALKFHYKRSLFINKYKWHRVNVERLNSTNTSVTAALHKGSGTPYIPEPPPVPDTAVSEIVQSLQEPTFASIGLGGWGPIGVLQNGLEFLHIGLDLPWYLAIAAGTCVVRVLMFPLLIFAQRNAAKMHNNMPQMQILQMKMSEARQNGDAIDAAKYGYELMKFMKDKDMNPLKNFIVPLIQAPVFLSFFMAIRGMANLPVESMKTGGLYWFTNLTIPDPFYLLPVMTCTTLLIAIELGAESGVRLDSMQMMRYALRCLPLVIFPFVINFPAGILCYWATSNFLTLIQVGLLRLPPVRDFFRIERLVRHSKESLPMAKKNFVHSIKDAMTNARIAKEIEDRGRIDDHRFRKAGIGPIQKTYPYDPTKQHRSSSEKSAVGVKSANRN